MWGPKGGVMTPKERSPLKQLSKIHMNSHLLKQKAESLHGSSLGLCTNVQFPVQCNCMTPDCKNNCIFDAVAFYWNSLILCLYNYDMTIFLYFLLFCCYLLETCFFFQLFKLLSLFIFILKRSFFSYFMPIPVLTPSPLQFPELYLLPTKSPIHISERV